MVPLARLSTPIRSIHTILWQATLLLTVFGREGLVFLPPPGSIRPVFLRRQIYSVYQAIRFGPLPSAQDSDNPSGRLSPPYIENFPGAKQKPVYSKYVPPEGLPVPSKVLLLWYSGKEISPARDCI